MHVRLGTEKKKRPAKRCSLEVFKNKINEHKKIIKQSMSSTFENCKFYLFDTSNNAGFGRNFTPKTFMFPVELSWGAIIVETLYNRKLK